MPEYHRIQVTVLCLKSAYCHSLKDLGSVVLLFFGCEVTYSLSWL